MILRGSSFICKNAKQSVEYSCYGRNYDSVYKCKNINNPLKLRSDNARTKKLVKIYFSSLTSKINLFVYYENAYSRENLPLTLESIS